MNAPQDSARDSSPAVFAVAIGLLAIVIAAPSLFSVQLKDLDGSAILDERFEDHQTPSGMDIVSAMQLARGEEVVVLSNLETWETVRAEHARIWDPITKKQQSNRGGGFEGGGERGSSRGRGSGRDFGGGRGGGFGKGGFEGGFGEMNWDEIDLGPEGKEPWEIAFVWYPRELAEEVLPQQFGRRRFDDLRFIGKDGGQATVAMGPVVWAGYDTHYVLERQFAMIDEAKTFRDTLRVNLSLGSRGCVLHARWLPGVPGSIEAVSSLLEGFTPVESD